jgi:hypothetical protein
VNNKEKILLIDILKRFCYTVHMPSNRRGKAKLPEYGQWADMLQRCKNPKLRSYHLYGGRGIKVCKRWLAFDNFYEDMSSKPKGYTLERIDNSKDYTPENCKWASPQEQAFNRRDNHLLTHRGKTLPLTMWARQLGIKPTTLSGRIRRGWSISRAVGTIPRTGGQYER